MKTAIGVWKRLLRVTSAASRKWSPNMSSSPLGQELKGRKQKGNPRESMTDGVVSAGDMIF